MFISVRIIIGSFIHSSSRFDLSKLLNITLNIAIPFNKLNINVLYFFNPFIGESQKLVIE